MHLLLFMLTCWILPVCACFPPFAGWSFIKLDLGGEVLQESKLCTLSISEQAHPFVLNVTSSHLLSWRKDLQSPSQAIRVLSFAALSASLFQNAVVFLPKCWITLLDVAKCFDQGCDVAQESRAACKLRRFVLLLTSKRSERSHLLWSTAVLPNKGFPTLKVSCAASHFIPAFHTSFLAFDIRSASRWAESSPACDPLWKGAARQHAYFLWYCLHMFSSRISLLGVNHIYMSMCNSETPRCHLHLVLVQPSAGSSGAVAKDLWLG